MGRGEDGKRLEEVIALAAIVFEHESAVRYDLLSMGLRLDDVGLTVSWLDLAAVLQHCPANSALQRELNPDHPWDLKTHLLALIADQLAIANWQRSGGGKNKRPIPIERPGHRHESGADNAIHAMENGVVGSTSLGTAMPADELTLFLGLDSRFDNFI